tara:strand:+ start:61 stop:183 length:123 start_codon:yes stop_codon:yes gene_type:complete
VAAAVVTDLMVDLLDLMELVVPVVEAVAAVVLIHHTTDLV